MRRGKSQIQALDRTQPGLPMKKGCAGTIGAEEADERLRRLYQLVEDGRSEVDDLLNERIANLKVKRAQARAALDERNRQRGPSETTDRCSSSVEVDDREVRIIGCKEVPEHAILATLQSG